MATERACRVAFTGGGDGGAGRRAAAESIAQALAGAGRVAPALDVLDVLPSDEGARLVAQLEDGLEDADAWRSTAGAAVGARARAGGTGGAAAVACVAIARRADPAGLRAATNGAAVIAAADPAAAAALVWARRAADGPRAGVLAVVPGVAAHPAWAAADADRYAVAHEDVAAELRDAFVPAERVRVTGVPGDAFGAPAPGVARHELGLLEGARVILCFASEVASEAL